MTRALFQIETEGTGTVKTVPSLVLELDLPIRRANFQQQQRRKINKDGLDKVKVGVRQAHGGRQQQLWQSMVGGSDIKMRGPLLDATVKASRERCIRAR